MDPDHDAIATQDDQASAFALIDAYADKAQFPGETPDRIGERLRSLATAYHEIDQSWVVAARSAIGQVERERQQALAAPAPKARCAASSWRARLAATAAGVGVAMAGFLGLSVIEGWSVEATTFLYPIVCGAAASLLAWRRAPGFVRCLVGGALMFEGGLALFMLYFGLRYGDWLPQYPLRAIAQVGVLGAASGAGAYLAAQVARVKARKAAG